MNSFIHLYQAMLFLSLAFATITLLNESNVDELKKYRCKISILISAAFATIIQFIVAIEATMP